MKQRNKKELLSTIVLATLNHLHTGKINVVGGPNVNHNDGQRVKTNKTLDYIITLLFQLIKI